MTNDHNPTTEKDDTCHEFVDTGKCRHSDVEHDAMADGRLDDFEYTLTRRALRQIKAEAWARGYEARRGEDPHGPGESNPHLTFPPATTDGGA